jgi:hypothetical protein
MQGARQAGVRAERQFVQGVFDNLFRVGNSQVALHLRYFGLLLSISFFLLRMPFLLSAPGRFRKGLMALFRSFGCARAKKKAALVLNFTHRARGLTWPITLIAMGCLRTARQCSDLSF